MGSELAPAVDTVGVCGGRWIAHVGEEHGIKVL